MSAYYSYWGPFQGLMPFYEQGNLANAFNYSSPSYFHATQDTVNATHQAVLACPSDPEVIGWLGDLHLSGAGWMELHDGSDLVPRDQRSVVFAGP